MLFSEQHMSQNRPAPSAHCCSTALPQCAARILSWLLRHVLLHDKGS